MALSANGHRHSAIQRTENRARVSVIVPTLNEIENIDPLISAILAEADSLPDFEILVADGGSTDGTVERVQAWSADDPVRLIASTGRGGLAGDVLAAARQAIGDVVVVMDADFSHPPARIPDLVRPIMAETSDMVVGSRYVPGGETPDWPLPRYLLSRLGGILAWPLTDLRDPMSGFFAVRRDRLLAVDPNAAGFKIGLEVIAEGGDALRLTEVPITFRDRIRGESKIGPLQMLAYIRRLMVLAGGAVSASNAARFATVGLLGLGIDFLVFQVLFLSEVGLVTAHVASFAVATIANYLLNSRWAFAEAARGSPEADWRRYPRFLAVCLMALFMRGGILALAVNGWGWSPQLAILLGVAAAAVINYLGNAFFIFPSTSPRVPRSVRWRIAALGIFAYVVILRLIFLGLPDLLPEEAYYWNYSQHLDIGYLDHPPMVAWLIWLGTAVFGNTEFAVRLGAFLSWLATAFFCFQFTRNLFGKSAAFLAVLLLSVLPFFFATGLLMTPDAPLTAAWAGALYFLERALLGERRAAWWGVGVCVGLGMLSKYTIALLGPATLLFLLLDPRMRRWLRRPEPYIAVLIAALLFSPVIFWNATHAWASFLFQGPRRLLEPFEFSFPELLGSVLILLTPLGLTAAVAALLPAGDPASAADASSPVDRRRRFIAAYTLVPLSVFVAFSLSHSVKLNWTGPLWLAVLPAIASNILAGGRSIAGTGTVIRRMWVPTVTITVLMYGVGLHYLVLGLPGVGYSGNLRTLPVAWKEFGRQAETIEEDVERTTGQEPLLVGMDKYFLSSQLAFYRRAADEGVQYTAGRSLFGEGSLMYGYWFSADRYRGKEIILFALSPKGLSGDLVEKQFDSLGPIKEKVLTHEGTVVGRFYYRVGYHFRAL